MPVELKKGQKAKWDWKLQSDDINFVASFENAKKEKKEIVKQDRIKSHQQEFVAEEDGTLLLFFDNSFSWVSGKTVVGIVNIQ